MATSRPNALGKTGPKPIPVDVRFFRHVLSDQSGCWLWTGGKTNGYGSFHLKVDGRWQSMPAHVWAYRNFIGPVPEGLDLDHLCRVRPCVNPTHLEAVTHQLNCQRGMAPSAIAFRNNSCTRGHEFTPENTYVYVKTGQRWCMECRRTYMREYFQRRKRESAA